MISAFTFTLRRKRARKQISRGDDLSKVSEDVTPTVRQVATSKQGEGHDNFMNGIIVQMDLTLTNKAWVEAERYHFLDFVSSQSTMHRITKFDLDSAYIDYVDPRMVQIMKEKVQAYNDLQARMKETEEPAEKQTLQAELNERYLRFFTPTLWFPHYGPHDDQLPSAQNHLSAAPHAPAAGMAGFLRLDRNAAVQRIHHRQNGLNDFISRPAARIK